jgi:cell division protein FtsQ
MSEDNLTPSQRAKRLADLVAAEDAGRSISEAVHAQPSDQPVGVPRPLKKPRVRTGQRVRMAGLQGNWSLENIRVGLFDKFQSHMILTLSLLGLLTVGLVYFLSPLSEINNIEVVGTEQLTKKEVLTDIGLAEGQSVWATVRQAPYLAEQAKNRDNRIKRLSIQLVGAQTIRVVVQENVEVGYLFRDNRYYPLLANGNMINQGTQTQPGQLPVYENFKSDTKLRLVMAEVGTLSTALRHNISEVIWSPDNENANRIVMYMNDGNQVYISANAIKAKMKYYPGIASQLPDTGGTVDLQVAAFATPYGQ